MLSVLIPNKQEINIQETIRKIEMTLPATEIIIAVDREGKGKGWAIREALKHAKGKYIAFLDADGDIEPRMLRRLIPFLADFDIVVGSKQRGRAPRHRRIITHLSRIYIRLIFGLPCDTQTGIKLFTREALKKIGPWKMNGFAYDMEILRKAHLKELRIIEVPIEAYVTAPVSWKALWQTFIESLKIRFRS